HRRPLHSSPTRRSSDLGTLIATIDMLKRAGARRIKGIFLVAAPEGIEAVKAVHPDVEIYTAAIDAQLNDKGYILPGLGDAGDRRSEEHTSELQSRENLV